MSDPVRPPDGFRTAARFVIEEAAFVSTNEASSPFVEGAGLRLLNELAVAMRVHEDYRLEDVGPAKARGAGCQVRLDEHCSIDILVGVRRGDGVGHGWLLTWMWLERQRSLPAGAMGEWSRLLAALDRQLGALGARDLAWCSEAEV